MKEKDKPLIDFDTISTKLGQMLAEGPVFVFCLTGNLSGGLAIKHVMDGNKLFSLEIALTFVIQRRYELMEIPSWLIG